MKHKLKAILLIIRSKEYLVMSMDGNKYKSLYNASYNNLILSTAQFSEVTQQELANRIEVEMLMLINP